MIVCGKGRVGFGRLESWDVLFGEVGIGAGKVFVLVNRREVVRRFWVLSFYFCFLGSSSGSSCGFIFGKRN